MNWKKIITAIVLTLHVMATDGQVNLQKGTAELTVPLYRYSDNTGRFSLNVTLLYNSGNGLMVDQLSGNVGTNWEIDGIPMILRIQKGQPDDQMEKDGPTSDLNKYPAGYMYNPKPVSAGCPTQLTHYPLFPLPVQSYQENNTTTADTEQDLFQLIMGGRTVSFVIDKQKNVISLTDNRLVVSVFTDALTDNCRTTIRKFQVVDEQGLVYEFSERELMKLYRYETITYPFANPVKWSDAREIPNSYNPYIANAWYISRISDPRSNRDIEFEYDTQQWKYASKSNFQTKSKNLIKSGDPNLSFNAPEFNGLLLKNEVQKKVISQIVFPGNERVLFNYKKQRLDVPGSAALTDVTIYNNQQERLTKIKLTQSYFIKNQIKEPAAKGEAKWARLCLLKIQRYGATDFDFENPVEYDYYTGTNSTENFVPPHNFHAKDQWGYYNGDFSGVTTTDTLNISDKPSWNKVCLYNQGHDYGNGDNEVILTCKKEYAQNGLLKKVKGVYGSETEYIYEQNTFDEKYILTKYNDNIVGGVHVAKVIQRGQEQGDEMITEYAYTMADGSSSLWGVEIPKFYKLVKNYYEAENKFFTGPGCEYRYTYPARKSITEAGTLLTYYRNYQTAKSKLMGGGMSSLDAFSRTVNSNFDFEGYVLNVVMNLLKNIVLTCLSPAPSNGDEVHSYSQFPINYLNPLPAQYRRVVVRKLTTSGLTQGYTAYNYTSDKDFPLLIPNNRAPYTPAQRSLPWVYGLPKSITLFDNNSKLVQSNEYSYVLKTSRDGTADNTLSCNCDAQFLTSKRMDYWQSEANTQAFAAATIPGRLKVEFYNIKTGRIEMDESTERIYNAAGNAVVNTTVYSYNAKNYLTATTKSTDSRGRTVETKNYYVEDYDLNAAGNSVLNDMNTDHNISASIATEVWQQKPGGQPEMLSAFVNEYGISTNGNFQPLKKYVLETDQPVPASVIGLFDNTKLVRNNLLIPASSISYDNKGNAVQSRDLIGNKIQSLVYDYNGLYPVASIQNASAAEVAYTSFEADGASSNWQLGSNMVVSDVVPTGNKCLLLGNSPVTTAMVLNKDYTLTFWANGASFSVNGGLTPALTTHPVNGWTLYRYNIPAGAAAPVITGTCSIDELRLYPVNADMTTTTYIPGTGKTCVCDINNRIVYYEYDGMGRISKEKDEQKNIIKTYEYHSKN